LASAFAPALPALDRPRHSPWLIGVVVAMAAFMEVLDTSIANVALPYMAGSLGASNDQSTWVLTSYLVSNAIVLPLSGWLADRFGRKRFFMACLVLFTASSFLCGMAPSLAFLIVARIVQGAGGGGLQPMAQAILADTFPPRQRGLAFALYGITAVTAPTIGPTLGGWLTDNYSWHWIFFINLPVGALTLLLVARLVEDPPQLLPGTRAGVRLDYVGIALLVLGIGALQVVLDRGQQDDWLGSSFIATLAIIAALCLLALVVWEWFQVHPIVDVRLFRSFNFLGANLMMFMLGVVLFASIVMMPLYLQTLMGYTAETAGLALSVGGVVLMLQMPIVGQLAGRVEARRLISAGWLALALAMGYSALRIDLQMGFAAVAWLRVFQVIGLGLLFVPVTLAAYVGMPPDRSNSVAGLINFMRNIGSSVGTSMVATLTARYAQINQSYLVSATAPDNPTFEHQVRALTALLESAGLGLVDAEQQAYARLYRVVEQQAQTLAYIDTYWVLAGAAAVMFALSFVLRRNAPGGGGAVAG
jgi:DHA2 family multidrug resistance protein